MSKIIWKLFRWKFLYYIEAYPNMIYMLKIVYEFDISYVNVYRF
jgi:hypothetical protein